MLVKVDHKNCSHVEGKDCPIMLANSRELARAYFINSAGISLCVGHLPLQAQEMFVEDPNRDVLFSSASDWLKIEGPDAECDECPGGIHAAVKARQKSDARRAKKAAKNAETSPKPKSAHANCSHEKTPAARAKCRREANKK